MRVKFLQTLILALILALPRPGWSGPVSQDALERALLSGKWAAIDDAAASWIQKPEYQSTASVIRGYAALATGNPAVAVEHFLRAGLGKNYPQASAWAEAFAASHPGNAVAQLLGADALARKGDTKAALERIDRALRLDPELHVARLSRAMLHITGGDYEPALKDLNRLVTTLVAADALVMRAVIQLDQKKFPGAAEDLAQALKLAPDHAIAYNTLGILQAHQNKWDAAAAAFESAFQRASDLVQARTNWQIAGLATERGTVLSEKNHITILVSDFGIKNWDAKQKLFDDFKNAKVESLIPNLPKQGQIMVPMPSDNNFPKNAAERDLLKLQIARGIIEKVEAGNLKTYEVRITQHIGMLGYLDPFRQDKIKAFGAIVYEALALSKSYFTSKGTSVAMPAIVGSNGAFMLTETLPKLKSNPIDRAVLVDGRAYIAPTMETYRVLGGKLAAINTSGDVPARPDMIANHASMKSLKTALPDMHLFWADSKGIDIFITKHLATMHPDASLLVKEFDGTRYTTPTNMTGQVLMSKSLGVDWSRPGSITPSPTHSFSNTPGGALLRTDRFITGDGGRVVFKSGAKRNAKLALVYTLFNLETGNDVKPAVSSPVRDVSLNQK